MKSVATRLAAAAGVLLFGVGLDLDAQAPASRNRILLDEAHHNLYAAASGGYRSFVQLVTEEGFAVTTNRLPFSPARLASTDILLIANANGLIGAHPITNGRDPSERLRAVTTTTGESIEGPPTSTALLRLSATAVDWVPPAAGTRELAVAGARDFNPCPTCATRPAGGRSQAIALEVGRGRMVVVGEMGVLTDYSVREADNRRFALNIVLWLAREL